MARRPGPASRRGRGSSFSVRITARKRIARARRKPPSPARLRALNQIRGGKISGIATNIASAVEEQGAATKEISRNVQETARGTAEVSANITGVSKAAEGTGSAASSVLGASDDLTRQSETLRQVVDRFVARLRAA